MGWRFARPWVMEQTKISLLLQGACVPPWETAARPRLHRWQLGSGQESLIGDDGGRVPPGTVVATQLSGAGDSVQTSERGILMRPVVPQPKPSGQRSSSPASVTVEPVHPHHCAPVLLCPGASLPPHPEDSSPSLL